MIKVPVHNKEGLVVLNEAIKDYFNFSAYLEDDEFCYPNTISMSFSEDFMDVKSTESARLARMKHTKKDVLDKLIAIGIEAEYVDTSKMTYNLNTGQFEERVDA